MIDFTPGFHSKLQFEDDGGLPFTLLSPLRYVTNVDHRGTFDVPAGFHTDLASIPRALWSVLPPVGRYDAAAVVHDFLYQTGAINGVAVTRSEADSCLNEAMAVLGVSRWQRWPIYLGVRVGGWVVWNSYRETQ